MVKESSVKGIFLFGSLIKTLRETELRRRKRRRINYLRKREEVKNWRRTEDVGKRGKM